MALLEPIFEALNRAQVRYVVVGGVAMVLHGFARFTADLDLAVDLSPPEARKAVETLVGLGFRPRAPVDAAAFANPEARNQWFRDKAMRVFALWDPTNPMRQVDLFIRNPIDFGLLWTHAEIMDVGVTSVRVASIADLIERSVSPDDRRILPTSKRWRPSANAGRAGMSDAAKEPAPGDDWEAGWETHRQQQLRLGLEATPAQRLQWLEEMIVLAYRAGALRTDQQR